LIHEYYALLRETEKNRPREIRAAIVVQKFWRMYIIRKAYLRKRAAVVNISRVYRGHMTRKRVAQMKEEDDEEMQMRFFKQQAAVIQRFFRGFHSRKYSHDFYARKKYIEHVKNKHEEVRKQLDDYHKMTELQEQKRQESTARAEFGQVVSSLHHLSSTKAIRGVYNPPYLKHEMKPQAFNVDIETHLKTTFKSNYKWKAPDKEKIEFFKTMSKEQSKVIKQTKRNN